LHVAHTPARFLALGLETEPGEDGETKPQEYPKLPSKPTRPAASASAATLEFYREEAKVFLAVRSGITAVRNKLLASVGQVISDELRLLRAGELASLTLPDILEYLDETYGEPSEEELTSLTATLTDKFTAVATFRADAPKMKLTFFKLADFGQEISEMQKMTYLQEAVQFLPPIVEAIKDYKKEVASLKSRSFDDMVTYIKAHVPLTTAGIMSYVGSAVTRNTTAAVSGASTTIGGHHPTASEIADELYPRLVAHYAAAGFGRAPTAAGRGDGRGRGPGRAGGKAGRGLPAPAAIPPRKKPYCFFHGCIGHAGEDCEYMEADHTFTAAMKRATEPCNIDGWEGSTFKVGKKH